MIRRLRSDRASRTSAVRPRRRIFRPRQSWLSVLVAVGLLLAQGPMLLHLVLVRHATCEHGELVEAEAAAPRRAIALEARTPQPRVEATDGPGRSGHEHCDLCALRYLPGEIAPFIGAASLLCVAPEASLGERDESRPVPLLLLAPKSSPPTV